jgi:EAL domain-containing protein (putative c-di-GMP-specific phosphodiesterase class I)
MEALRAVGCDKVQGYLLSASLPASQVESLLIRGAGIRS